MLPTALVPLRVAPFAKRRLAHLVPGPQRAALVLALFDHVVGALQGAGLHVVALTASDVDVPDGVDVWIDERPGLNRCVRGAIARTGVPAIVVHADLPAISSEDVLELLETPGDVVIARARDGGTNALLLRSELEPSFGPRSALVHAQRARAAGLRTLVVDRPGLALDIDDGAGLTASSWPSTSRTTWRTTSQPTSSSPRRSP